MTLEYPYTKFDSLIVSIGARGITKVAFLEHPEETQYTPVENLCMRMMTESYTQQNARWPKTGKHILAQFDDSSIIVYQAYRPSIGKFAALNHYFGGDFSYERMSWIKPNFLWMMYRSGWGTKPGQEIILAIRLNRNFFDRLLEIAIASNFPQVIGLNETEWKAALPSSSVRLQWDPEHNPHGKKLERKAIQLGLRNEALKEYGKSAIREINDISHFVAEQRELVTGPCLQLVLPQERIYIPKSNKAQKNIALETR